jgi:hypothetical protein
MGLPVPGVPRKCGKVHSALGILGYSTMQDNQWLEADGCCCGTQTQMEALKNLSTAINNTRLFDESERATLALTYELTRNITVAESTMARVRAMLPDHQVVELVGTTAGYNMVSRFLIATGIDLEE